MVGDCFPPETQYRVVPARGGYVIEAWIPGQAPYAATRVVEQEEALNWIVAEQEKTAAVDR